MGMKDGDLLLRLLRLGKVRLTLEQAVSWALLRHYNTDYLQRDYFDWVDFIEANKN